MFFFLLILSNPLLLDTYNAVISTEKLIQISAFGCGVCCMQLELCFCAGFETARSLALHGSTVVFVCRDINRSQAAIERIKKERAHAICDVIELDLARLHSVRKFAASMKLRYK
jgi:hypothetical protein